MLLGFLIYILFKNAYVAAIIALLFGIHPMAVECITWIPERKTLLATFFALISIIMYIYHTKKPKHSFYVWSIIFYALSILSKPTTIGLPIVFILLDIWPLKRMSIDSFKKITFQKIPMFAVAMVSAVITYISQRSSPPLSELDVVSILTRILRLGYQLIFYPILLIYPHNLTAHYPIPDLSALNYSTPIASLLAPIVIALLIITTYKKTRSIFSGFLIFLVLLLPTMGIISFTDVLVRDNYAYFSFLGFFLIASFIDYLWKKGQNNKVVFYTMIIAVVMSVSGFYIYVSRDYIKYWKDTETYFRYMAKIDPYYPHLYNMIAKIYFQTNRVDEAISNTNIAIKLDPKNPEFYNNLGLAYESKGDVNKSIEYFKKAIEKKPENIKANFALGILYNRIGKFNDAISYLSNLVKISPQSDRAYYALAFAQLRSGKVDESFTNINKAIGLSPYLYDTNYLLAEYYFNKRMFDKSLEVFEKMLKWNLSEEQKNRILNTQKMIKDMSQ